MHGKVNLLIKGCVSAMSRYADKPLTASNYGNDQRWAELTMVSTVTLYHSIWRCRHRVLIRDTTSVGFSKHFNLKINFDNPSVVRHSIAIATIQITVLTLSVAFVKVNHPLPLIQKEAGPIVLNRYRYNVVVQRISILLFQPAILSHVLLLLLLQISNIRVRMQGESQWAAI